MSDRLRYVLNAAEGKVLLSWSEPIRFMRLPWQNAYAFAKQIVEFGLMAEVQAGIAVDRTTPQPVTSIFRPDWGDVKIDWGVAQLVFTWTPAEAFAIANGLVEAGEIAQRWVARGPGMLPKEVDKVEEAILGKPTLEIASTGKRPPPPFVPVLKQVYYYRPAECNATVLALFPVDRRANILLVTGRILEGVAWADLFTSNPAASSRVSSSGLGIPTAERVGKPGLS